MNDFLITFRAMCDIKWRMYFLIKNVEGVYTGDDFMKPFKERYQRFADIVVLMKISYRAGKEIKNVR